MLDDNVALIRRPVLTGHQLIDGLWLPRERFDEHAAARLILSQWQTGASAWRFVDGDLLRLRRPLSVHCETLTGWPLIRQGRALCSALLSPEEIRTMPTADLWLVRGSHVEALHLRDAEVLSPEQWIDISGYTLLDTYDCRSTLAEPDLDLLTPSADTREIFGDALAPVSPEREGVMNALQARQQNAQAGPKATAEAAGKDEWQRPDSTSSVWPKLGVAIAIILALRWLSGGGVSSASANDTDTWNAILKMIAATLIGAIVVTLLLAAVRALLQRRHSAQPASRPQSPGTADAPAKPPALPGRARPTQSRPALWRRLLTRLTLNSRLSALYGKRQADYMRRMLEMFESGDFQEALRHAIPLGDEQGSREQAFGAPKRRDDLSLNGQRGPARSMLMDEGMDDHLRKIYRHSFERLDREGRVDEAAFVLAELLKARQEALDYLETHGRHTQAAELALAWDMAPAMIVRLLCAAGDWQRAILVARRDDAFADAVALLQEKWPESADRLRLEWAEALTGKGLWLQAVDVVWSLPAERERAAQWLLNAEAAGGQLAIGALVKRAILLPDTLDAYSDWVEQLRDDPKRHAERAVLVRALLEHKTRGGALAWLAGAIANAVVADQAGGHGQLTQDQLKALIKMSKDNLLLTDLPNKAPPHSTVVPLDSVDAVQEWTAPELGSRPIFDAVPLDDQRYLIALGEAGAAVIDAHGKTVFHFPVPAQAIVIGHSRQVALVVARRSDVWRVSKLDLVNRSALDLGVLRFDVFARSFDGTGWTIGRDHQLRVVDADRDFTTLWHVSDLPGRVLALKEDEHNESIWLHGADGSGHVWHYRLPERRLAGNDPLPGLKHENSFLLLTANGDVTEVGLKLKPGADAILVLELKGNRKGYRLPGFEENTPTEDPLNLYLSGPWLVACYALAGEDTRVYFTHRGSDQLCARLDWPAADVQVRCVGSDWMLFDGQGRLSHISVAEGWQRNVVVN
ncbi:bpX6 domain-containing protein [Pseudomonas sp. 5P_5.1_Bac1]|uniref:bpX6 domain-containing protein n=1 Tax=Pseudomonas sp. 5P_5.1_Bac1 TaxID=2971616 RepID=UPI0021C62D97|nr:bpX6 domain-containing protein [Pseudomonas sp. 5P_5.1_Bac1]MCU1723376.1 bpX6 domain-containing protein [Pseudomonas sp. 5P_5.1_Bac1]